MADRSTGVRGPVWSQAHLLAPSGRTNPMGHPCPSFVPLLCFRVDPDLCRGKNIGPTGTSGHPFGPEVVLFWAAAGAMLMITLLLLFTGAAVESVRCGLEQGWTPKEVAATLAPVLSRLLRPRELVRPAPRFLHVSPLLLLKRTAWPVHYGFLKKTARLVCLYSLQLGTEST